MGKDLTKDQEAILDNKATEAPFTGALLHEKRNGIFSCVRCEANLFDSKTKFDSGTGWPSFYDAIPGAVTLKHDSSHGMERIEVICANCGGHLGHVFDDAPDKPTGKRYCINSCILDFNNEATIQSR